MTFFADSKWASHSLFSHGNIVVYFPAMWASFHLSNCHFNISQSSLLLHTGQHSLHYNTLHINDTHTRLLCQHFSFLRFAFHVFNFVHSFSSVSCVKSIKCATLKCVSTVECLLIMLFGLEACTLVLVPAFAFQNSAALRESICIGAAVCGTLKVKSLKGAAL